MISLVSHEKHVKKHGNVLLVLLIVNVALTAPSKQLDFIAMDDFRTPTPGSSLLPTAFRAIDSPSQELQVWGEFRITEQRG